MGLTIPGLVHMRNLGARDHHYCHDKTERLHFTFIIIFLSTQLPSSYLTVAVFVVRASILSSSGWSLPTATRECRGGPRSQWWISCSESRAIIWVTAPTLATPTHVVVAFRS